MIKKLVLFIGGFLLFSQVVLGGGQCFLAKEGNKIIKEEGDCSTPWAPQSTFKIPLSLIGFDSNILKSENDPSWSLPDGVDPYINGCKSDHNPRTWMRDSCLWYSRILTTKLGMEKFQNYVSKFAYGNMDISGGLTDAWMSSSLKISPEGQVRFLQNFIDHKLSVTDKAYQMIKNIMFLQELLGGWKLYGKTGNGMQSNLDKTKKSDFQQGWFVGFIQKNGRTIIFASHIEDDKKEDTFASFRARNEALDKLYYLINDLEK